MSYLTGFLFAAKVYMLLIYIFDILFAFICSGESCNNKKKDNRALKKKKKTFGHFGGLLLLFLLFQVFLPFHIQHVINVFHSKHNILVESADLLNRNKGRH